MASCDPACSRTCSVLLPGSEQVLLVPATAVSYAPYGDSVYVVETSKDGKQHTARQKFVRLGAARGDFVVVTKGLSAGDKVVITGRVQASQRRPGDDQQRSQA